MNFIRLTGSKIIISIFVVSLLMLIACSKKSNPTAPENTINNSDIKVLVLKDGGTEDSVYSILSNAGYNVTVGSNYYAYDGKYINNYDLVILLNGVDYAYDISDSTQNIIKNYVRDGGTLLTTEWMTYEIYYSSTIYQTLREILPSVYNDGYYYQNETYTKVTKHPITEALPDTFSISNSDWSCCKTILYNNSLCTDLKVLFSGDKTGAALTIGQLNKGYVIHWNMAGQYGGNNIWSDYVKKILTNIARFSGTN